MTTLQEAPVGINGSLAGDISTVASPLPFRFSVDQYHGMAEAGILRPEHRVELLRGIVVKKMTVYPPHANAVSKLGRMFTRELGESWQIRQQQPITLTDSEPEPDLVIAIGDDAKFDFRHPEPSDIELLIEVSDSSLFADREFKLPLYGQHNIRQYWIVNLVDKVIETYASPSADQRSYLERRIYSSAERILVRIGAMQPFEIAVKDVLPKEA